MAAPGPGHARPCHLAGEIESERVRREAKARRVNRAEKKDPHPALKAVHTAVIAFIALPFSQLGLSERLSGLETYI